MEKEEINELLQEIEYISRSYETKPWTENVKLLKADFDINSIGTPKHYLKIINELEELVRETRLLFLYSVFNKVCKEEDKLYYFDTPFQASMVYRAVMKKEGRFYLLDEDGDCREIFTSEKFIRFIDDLYFELYEQ